MKKQNDPRYKEINTRKPRLYNTPESYRDKKNPDVRFYVIKISVKGSNSDYYLNTNSVFLNKNITSSTLFDDYIIAKIELDRYLKTLDKDSKVLEVAIIQLSCTFKAIEKFKQVV